MKQLKEDEEYRKYEKKETTSAACLLRISRVPIEKNWSRVETGWPPFDRARRLFFRRFYFRGISQERKYPTVSPPTPGPDEIGFRLVREPSLSVYFFLIGSLDSSLAPLSLRNPFQTFPSAPLVRAPPFAFFSPKNARSWPRVEEQRQVRSDAFVQDPVLFIPCIVSARLTVVPRHSAEEQGMGKRARVPG